MLNERMKQAGFAVKKSFYFNALGIPAWMWGGLVSKSKTISSKQMNAYNNLVPIAKVIDKLFFSRIGLSVVVVGVKE